MTEWPGEVGLIVELHFDRHQRRGVSIQEAVARLLDASADDVSMRWDAEGMGEATDEVPW